jgi:hypothetical protein
MASWSGSLREARAGVVASISAATTMQEAASALIVFSGWGEGQVGPGSLNERARAAGHPDSWLAAGRALLELSRSGGGIERPALA